MHRLIFATPRCAPRRVLGACFLAALLLGGCALTAPDDIKATQQRLDTLLPTDAILLGEQHDAPDHQRVQREVVLALAARGALAALVLEMAEQGHGTAGLARDASETQVREALHWDNTGWPWRAYGPVVMAAVQASVPVLGANLPRAQMRDRMTDRQLDMQLPGPALKAQQQLIRQGHCDMLPENQITPMTRVQIARDMHMAQTIAGAATPGKTVLLLAGRGHVDRSLGVVRHLPPGLKAWAIGIGADPADLGTGTLAKFDQAWPAAPGPDIDHCERFKARSGAFERRQGAE